MNFQQQHQPPPQPPPFYGGLPPNFPGNFPGFPYYDDADFYRESADPCFEPVRKRARQWENNLLNFPPTINPRVNLPTSLSGSKGTSHIFYKTRLCAKFAEGNCKNGNNCTFAHGVEDLRYPPPNWQELVREKEWRWNEDQRRIQSMNLCKKFYNGEECPYGHKCNFLHERRSFLEAQMGNPETARERESSAVTIGVSSNGSGVYGNKVEKTVERSNFDHVETGSHTSHSHDEVNIIINSCVIQAKPLAASVGDPSPVATASDPIKRGANDKDVSRWKLNKKINCIYADWIDYLTPPQGIEGDARVLE